MTAEIFSITADRPNQETLPLMAVARESDVKNVGMREQNLLSLSYGEIVRKDINSADGLLPASFETYQIVEPGMTVLRFTDLQNDQRSLRSGLVTERGIITSAYVAVDPFAMNPQFFAYLMRAYDTNKVFYGMGGGVRQGLNFESIRRLPVPLLPADEQRAIADYLDQETAQIDALVAKQEEFIGLLRERRRAVVEHALSRIEANRAALRHFSVLVSGSGFPVDLQGRADLELPFFKVANLKSADRDGVLVRSEHTIDRTTAKALRATVIPKGALVFAKVGAALLLGRVGALPDDGCIDNNMSALIFDESIDLKFARYLVLTFDFREFVLPGPVPSLDMEGLREFKVPVLSLDRQRVVADSLDEETSRIDTLIEKAEEHIALARERRAALITAAVTGQFDVRTARKAG